jgi:hypothetical protein
MGFLRVGALRLLGAAAAVVAKHGFGSFGLASDLTSRGAGV